MDPAPDNQLPDEEAPSPTERLQPGDLQYRGAFRLPEGSNGCDWSWSGEALAYHPGGDGGGPDDGFPGSLFGTGHNWLQWVSEISIPAPVVVAGGNLDGLPLASTLQPFADIRAGLFDWPLEIPRAGLACLPAQGSQTAGKLYCAWAQHMGEGDTLPSHGWAGPDLDHPDTAGPWRIAGFWNYVTGDYLLAIPDSWADGHAGGRRLGTGRFRDGGQGAMGPSLLALAPWRDGDPPAPGTTIEAQPLLLYDSVYEESPITLSGYHHSDEWSSAAWLETDSKAAVVFAGTKGRGDCWYGFANGVVWPDEPPYPPIPPPPHDERGWWSDRFEAVFLFYDPADLAEVAAGKREPSWPQPYAELRVDGVLFGGYGDRQKGRFGACAWDASRRLLYVMEPLVDEEKPVVHVWQARG
ncbi:MAG: hypothetical protein JXO51_04035 [Candidatus Aminicenantes bacterium]|nr:hypothetical protein [Candidatus Aminicenantes bacterium]